MVLFHSKAPYRQTPSGTSRVRDAALGSSGSAGVGAEGTRLQPDPAGKRQQKQIIPHSLLAHAPCFHHRFPISVRNLDDGLF